MDLLGSLEEDTGPKAIRLAIVPMNIVDSPILGSQICSCLHYVGVVMWLTESGKLQAALGLGKHMTRGKSENVMFLPTCLGVEPIWNVMLFRNEMFASKHLHGL